MTKRSLRSAVSPGTGIVRTAKGWRTFVRVDGVLRTKRWKPDTTLHRMKGWREEQRVRARLGAELPAAGTRFEDDAQVYLPAVAAMPSIQDRRLHMAEWARVFAGRRRDDITPIEIRTVLERLRATYAASSVNKRRTALMSFYAHLNGKSGYNPVRDVPKYPEADEPRDQPLGVLYRLLACMRPSQTRARLRVFLWTGWPHATVARLKPEHLRLDEARTYLLPRRKGKGRQGVWLPLLPGAVIALREFHQWDCYTREDQRPFSASAMHKSVRLALVKLNAHRAKFKHPPLTIRPYDFRHSFGTWVADHIEDDRVLQELMLHSRPEQSLRYTRRATSRRLARGMAILSQKVTLELPSGEKLQIH